MKIFFHSSLGTYANTYLLGPEEGGAAILIDPGQIDLPLIERIESNNFTISHVLLTHRHPAHSQGLGTLMKIYNPILYAGNPTLYDYRVTQVKDRQIFTVASMTVEAIHIPGHTIDSFVYRIENALFTGDVLYAGRIGSTQGVLEKALLLKGIKHRILTLDERMVIFPGHGTVTTIKIEKLFNHDLIEAMAMDDLAQLSHPSIIT